MIDHFDLMTVLCIRTSYLKKVLVGLVVLVAISKPKVGSHTLIIGVLEGEDVHNTETQQWAGNVKQDAARSDAVFFQTYELLTNLVGPGKTQRH